MSKLKSVQQGSTKANRHESNNAIAVASNDLAPKQVRRSPAPGIAAVIRAAREAQSLSWYALAQQAGIREPGTVRDIERGTEVRVAILTAVAQTLGLALNG